MIKMTPAQVNKITGSCFKTGNKYNATKVNIDGQKFQSAGEGDYYSQLKIQEKAGLIKGIDTQAKEEFYAYEKFICNYYVDFKVYHLDDTIEFIEYKGKSTDLWRLKWKMLLAKYANEITQGKVKCTIVWHKTKYKYKKK